MNHAARPLAFSYVRSQGPRGITIRTGRESPAQDSPQSPSAGKAKRPHNADPPTVMVRVACQVNAKLRQ